MPNKRLPNLFLWALAGILTACGGQVDAPESLASTAGTQSNRVIFDSDFGYDVDDVGALAVLHTLGNQGRVSVQATTTTVSDPDSAGAMNAVNFYYRRYNLTPGQYKGTKWRNAYGYWGNYGDYLPVLNRAQRLSSSNVSASTRRYRSILAVSPAKSVTFVTVGFLQNMSDLLNSPGDSISPKTGRQLIAEKVKELVIMGAPTYGTVTQDFNLEGARGGNSVPESKNVVNNWPSTLVFNTGGLCHSIVTGETLSRKTPFSNPVRRAYEVFRKGPNRGRPSWDLCSSLYVGRKDLFKYDSSRHVVITGTNPSDFSVRWVSGRGNKGEHRKLMFNNGVSARQIEATLEALLVTPPR